MKLLFKILSKNKPRVLTNYSYVKSAIFEVFISQISLFTKPM